MSTELLIVLSDINHCPDYSVQLGGHKEKLLPSTAERWWDNVLIFEELKG